jgi:acetolactate synthase I/II/III large subunit
MSDARPPTVALAFAHALRAAGVERVYGLPGEDHLRLLDALPEAGIRYVAARDETAAVIMAAAEAQATGRVGVVLVTLAPGITNAVNGIAHAWLDGVPLLVVSGQHQPERAPAIVRQSLDSARLVDSVCKLTLSTSARIHQVLARAFETALVPPSGPVFLELRDDVAAAPPLDRLDEWPPLFSRTQHVRGALVSLPSSVASAHRPALIVGGACPGDSSVREALARIRAPVFTSPSAMGIVSPDNPWFAGTFMNGNFEADLLSRCDVIVTVGLDAKDFFNGPWRYSAPVAAINEHPDIQRFVPVQHQIVGGTAAALESLRSCSEWSVKDVTDYRWSVERPFHLDDGAFTVPSAVRAARGLLPDPTLVAVDAGFGKPLTSYLWSTDAPNRYLTAHGLSTMGYALPAANALKLAHPRQPVVGFMGDGSLLMRIGELTVAVEQAIAPVYVAWMDGSLSQIETKQLRQGLAPVGARVPNVSCARIAEAFGARGRDTHSLAEFCAAVEEALESELPTLIGAYVDQSCRAEWFELMRG